MRRRLLTILLLLPCMSVLADEPTTHLVVWAKDGTSVVYALNDLPQITFSDTDLVIKANGVEVNYALDKMARFTYEAKNSSAIRNLQTDEVCFKLDGESLLFPSLKANSTVSLYTLGGTQVFKKIIQEPGEYSFPLSSLNTGIYMVNVNGLTYKIVKR